MDFIPDDSIIKQEEIPEKNDDCLEFCLYVKVENAIEWPSIQTAKSENYRDRIKYEPDDSLYHLPINRESSVTQKYQGQVVYQIVKEESAQTCMLCRKYFPDSKTLFQHNLCHLEVPLVKPKLFMCEYCPKYCKIKADLINHIKINHTRQYSKIPITKQIHKCSICNKTYSYKAWFTWFSHMREVHGNGKFPCNKCNLMFKCKRYLTKHLRVHDENKLKRKLYYRIGVKKNCPKCPAILESKHALKTHIRNCHSDKKFKCHLCNSMLKCQAYLLGHMIRVHHNDGIVHACELCGKEFKSARYLRVHKKNSH